MKINNLSMDDLNDDEKLLVTLLHVMDLYADFSLILLSENSIEKVKNNMDKDIHDMDNNLDIKELISIYNYKILMAIINSIGILNDKVNKLHEK